MAAQKIEAILVGRIEESEMRLLRSCLEEQDRLLSKARRKLRRQDQDFTTVFEMIGQISSRVMDPDALLKYLVRTVMGHFMVPKVLVLRRCDLETDTLVIATSHDTDQEGLQVDSRGALAAYALEHNRAFELSREELSDCPETGRFLAAGLVTCVPLVQRVGESKTDQLEGLLFMGQRLIDKRMDVFDFRMLGLLGQAVAINFHNELLYRRSIVDYLTGVSSRGYFEAHLRQEVGRISRYGNKSISLVMLDLDDFKNVNDQHGHLAGDEVLKEVAQVLRQTVRSVDMVARYGGEEFAIVLIEIEMQKALEVTERLRQGLENISVDKNGKKIGITGSFGLACFPGDACDTRELVEAADKALYEAKTGGRNRVYVASAGQVDQV